MTLNNIYITIYFYIEYFIFIFDKGIELIKPIIIFLNLINI
jgi:hypothetical protein